MSNRQSARRAAFNRCGETCPAVEKQIGELFDKFEASLIEQLRELCTSAKDASYEKGTSVLREALVDCEGDLNDAEDTAEALRSELADARLDIERHERTIAQLEAELREARQEADQ